MDRWSVSIPRSLDRINGGRTNGSLDRTDGSLFDIDGSMDIVTEKGVGVSMTLHPRLLGKSFDRSGKL